MRFRLLSVLFLLCLPEVFCANAQNVSKWLYTNDPVFGERAVGRVQCICKGSLITTLSESTESTPCVFTISVSEDRVYGWRVSYVLPENSSTPKLQKGARYKVLVNIDGSLFKRTGVADGKKTEIRIDCDEELLAAVKTCRDLTVTFSGLNSKDVAYSFKCDMSSFRQAFDQLDTPGK